MAGAYDAGGPSVQATGGTVDDAPVSAEAAAVRTGSGGVAEALRTVGRGVGQLLITLGVILLLFVAYELWFTNLYTNAQQHALARQLQRQWSAPAAPAAPGAALNPPFDGQGMAILYIPRLGRDYHEVIVQGVSVEDLRKGPGHYPGTAMPGQIGNFVLSGHRTTYGAPFNRLGELRRGDAIVVETRTTWYVYDVTSIEIVLPTDLDVIAPVPDHPGVRPTKAMITLTTCNPEFSATQRLIVHGQLVSSQPRSAGAPAALQLGA